MKLSENQKALNKLQNFSVWLRCHLTPEESLCDSLSSDSRDTFVEIRVLTYMKKSLTQDSMRRQVLTYTEKSLIQVSMRRQDRLFEKADIKSWIIGVFDVWEWISQTRSAINWLNLNRSFTRVTHSTIWIVHSLACLSYKFTSLLYCISHLSYISLSSII